MSTVLLDTHTVHWWSEDDPRLSRAAIRTLSGADELAVSAVTWFELAWLAHRERIVLTTSVRHWLDQLSKQLRTIEITPAIAVTAATLPATFPGDPIDRVIYATAVEHGWPLVTRDERMRAHRHPTKVTVW